MNFTRVNTGKGYDDISTAEISAQTSHYCSEKCEGNEGAPPPPRVPNRVKRGHVLVELSITLNAQVRPQLCSFIPH